MLQVLSSQHRIELLTMEDASKIEEISASKSENGSELHSTNHWLEGFFSSVAEAQDTAVIVALNGQSLEEELKAIAAFYDEKRKDLSHYHEPRIQNLRQTIERRSTWLEDKLKGENSLKNELETAKRDWNNLQGATRGLQKRKQLAWQKVLKQRFERITRFFTERETRLVESLNQSRTEALNDADNQISYLHKFYDLIINNREEHSEKLKARADECIERRGEIRQQLEIAQSEVRSLREIGVTEYSATFLLMFGVLALAGAGSAAASLLGSRQPGNSIFGLMLENVLQALSEIHGPWGTLAKFGGLLIAPVIAIFLLFVVFVVFVRLAIWVASKYTSQKSAKQKANRGSQPEEWGGAPIIAYISRLSSQFSLIDGFKADRESYGQVIAYFPYLMLVVIGLFLFSGIAIDSTKINLTVMLIGIALALLSASSTLLYVTYIIQPRWKAALDQYKKETPSKGFFIRYLALNFEFFSLLALLIIALLVAAFLPSSVAANTAVAANTTVAANNVVPYLSDGQFKLISWGFVTVFMLLASFGLAYGIVQKGIFHEAKELWRKHKAFQNCVEKYSYPPLIEDLGFPDQTPANDSLNRFIDREDALEDVRSAYELGQMFTPGEEEVIAQQEKRRRWPRWLRKFVKFLLAEEKTSLDQEGVPVLPSPEMTLKPIDYLDSEEAVKEYELSELELSEQSQRSTTTTNLIASLRTSLNVVSEEIKKLLLEIEGLRNQEVKAEQEFREMLSRVNSNFRRDENAFKTAFGVGQQLRALNTEPDTVLAGSGTSLPTIERAEL
jgi:hypothetical protein